ncbi:XRE family transcriptional regulator, partial [Streptococcus pneumoniae]|nr:XRE family transcriptional regulator [Streptococcus pneumoniae]
ENLPEEEQLIVDVTQARFDIYGSSDVTYGLGLVEEYFQQLLKKKYFSVNDLLIIELYFFCCAMGLEDKEHFEELA